MGKHEGTVHFNQAHLNENAAYIYIYIGTNSWFS